MLQTYKVPAGGRQIDAKATFFRYESSGAAGVDETISVRADGQDLGTYLPGDNVRLPVHATRWQITPAGATQTCIVRLGLGSVDTARLAGIVSVTNKIGASVTQIEVTSGLLATGFLTFPVIAVADNPRGILVRKVSVFAVAGAGASDIQVTAAPVVPGSTVPANAFTMARTSPSGASADDTRKDMNYQLPAGWGVWAVTNHTVAPTFASYTLTYELA
jgi:hypothetical protein